MLLHQKYKTCSFSCIYVLRGATGTILLESIPKFPVGTSYMSKSVLVSVLLIMGEGTTCFGDQPFLSSFICYNIKRLIFKKIKYGIYFILFTFPL